MTLTTQCRSIYVVTRLKWPYYCLFALISAPIAAQTNDYQKHSEIYKVAYDFAKGSFRPDQDIEVTVGKLDPRLRLADCSQSLVVDWPASSLKMGKVSIGVSCSKKTAWKVFITAHIKEFKKLYTTTRQMLRGDTLNPTDLTLERQELSSARNGYIIDLNAYSGYTLARSVRIGEILSPKYLTAPKLIKRGTKVTLLARSKGLEIRMKGIAMSDGTEGETIKIRNLSSKKIIDAMVVSYGVAQVHL